MQREQQGSTERISKTALVIDDGADRRKYVKTLLQENGFFGEVP